MAARLLTHSSGRSVLALLACLLLYLAQHQKSIRPEPITETHQYRRRVFDAAGMSAYSDTLTIEFHTAPLNPGSIAASTPLSLCDNSVPGIILSTASLSGFGEKASYQWQISIGGGAWTNITGEIRENYIPTAPITTTTAFRRLGMDECGDTKRTAISNEVVFKLVPNIALKAGLVDGPFITCAGTAPGRVNSVLDACGSGSIRYQWEVNTGGGWSAITGATGASYTPGNISTNTTYRRKAVDECGKQGYSNEVMIYVYPPIEAGVIGNSQMVCRNQTPEKISLLTNCHYTDGTVSYQWQSATSFSGTYSNITGATGATYQPAASTITMYYRLRVSSTTCNFQAFTNVAAVSINPTCNAPIAAESTDRLMKVFPNPLTGTTIKVVADMKGKVNARLQSSDGQVVPVTIVKAANNQFEVKVPSNLSQGTYILQVFDNTVRMTEKILIQ